MNNEDIIAKTEEFVRKTLKGEGSGHDWGHVDKVRKNALKIAKEEKDANLFIVELAALLHDIADHKNHGGDYEIGPKKAREWLESLKIEPAIIDSVTDIVSTISYSKNAGPMKTLEGKIVQDADRLEALGAIGIARCFATGGKMRRVIYDPSGRDRAHSIQHFYDKLLKLKDMMNTVTGQRMAEERHRFMEDFLKRFYQEWEGNG